VIPVTAPADKRFLRAHVRPVRRRTFWRTAIRIARAIVLAGVLAFVTWRLVSAVVGAPAWRIDRISVTGTEHLAKSDVLALLDGLRGQSILQADLAAARRRLLASPWVADAVLRRRLPASIDVAITERRPMCIGRLGGRLLLIDERGAVMDEYGPKYAEFDLPLIDGLAAPDRTEVDARRIDLATRVLESLAGRPDVARRVSQIDVSDATDAVVLLDTDAALLRLGDRDFRQRIEDYLDLAPALRERVPSIDYVDLRYGRNVFVGAAGKPASAVGTTGAR
jgi:cell division protein FtsQ